MERDQKTQDAQTRNLHDIDDPLEHTQRLPLVGECNCPGELMITHCVGCPLRVEASPIKVELDLKTLRVTVTGAPLRDIGLDGAIVVHPDGTQHPLIGIFFHRWDNTMSMINNMRAAFGEQYPGCSLVFGPL